MSGKVGSLMMTREETMRAIPSVLRGTVVGSMLGILPGGGAALSSFGSYMMERKVSKGRHEFGTGAIEGVAGPEAANNAASQTSLHPAAHARHPGQRRDGADGRRADHPGHPARARAWWKRSPTCSGA